MPAPPATLTARERRIRRALRLLEHRFGPGVAWRLADARPRWTSPALPTGSLGLDLATGLDGYPRGQLVELFGPPSAGKATLLASALAAAQRRGGLVALIDVLGMADPEVLAGAGVGSVAVAGIATDYCVKATALSALEEGLQVRVLADLCAAESEDTGTEALAELEEAGAVLVHSGDGATTSPVGRASPR